MGFGATLNLDGVLPAFCGLADLLAAALRSLLVGQGKGVDEFGGDVYEAR
jgi:hypothetical protein